MAIRLSTLLRIGFFLGVLAILGWIVREGYCSQRCEGVLSEANELVAASKVTDALLAIDDADATCDCGRFGEGDEPVQLTLARTYLNLLRNSKGEVAAAEVTTEARGAILQSLGPEDDR